MTKEELQAIRERCDRATNDEWIVQDSEHNSSFKVEIKNPGKGAYNICYIAIGASYKKHDERFVRCKNNAEFLQSRDIFIKTWSERIAKAKEMLLIANTNSLQAP